MIDDYDIVKSDDPIDLIKQVKEKISCGWEPFGSIVFNQIDKIDQHIPSQRIGIFQIFLQPMITRSDDD